MKKMCIRLFALVINMHLNAFNNGEILNRIVCVDIAIDAYVRLMKKLIKEKRK